MRQPLFFEDLPMPCNYLILCSSDWMQRTTLQKFCKPFIPLMLMLIMANTSKVTHIMVWAFIILDLDFANDIRIDEEGLTHK
jgi:hypothetical protein